MSDLNELFDDHYVGCLTVDCSLDVELTVYWKRGAQREVPTLAHLANRRQRDTGLARPSRENRFTKWFL